MAEEVVEEPAAEAEPEVVEAPAAELEPEPEQWLVIRRFVYTDADGNEFIVGPGEVVDAAAAAQGGDGVTRIA